MNRYGRHFFFWTGVWATSAAISESSQEMSENWTGISTKILGQLSAKASTPPKTNMEPENDGF